MNHPSSLDGARVWITGASSGIGEAIIAPLVARGARVAISARRAGRLTEIAGCVAGARRGRARIPARRARSRGRAANRRRDRAGIRRHRPRHPERRQSRCPAEPVFDGQQFADNMALNYLGVVYGIEAVLPGMLARGRGHIAGVASPAGFRAVPAAAAYGASKAAVIHMLDSIRFELEPRGIAVTVVNPGS